MDGLTSTIDTEFRSITHAQGQTGLLPGEKDVEGVVITSSDKIAM